MTTIELSRHQAAASLVEQVYQNEGNPALLALVPDTVRSILDVGCGAGDNARLLRATGRRVWGVTLSPEEARIARAHCEAVQVANAEFDELELDEEMFDGILLSHVLEHMLQPARTLTRLARFLKPAGRLFIALPNMAYWTVRVRLLRGDWTRDPTGFLDRTHMQFFSFRTAPNVLAGAPYTIEQHVAGDPRVPTWPLRKVVPGLSRGLDERVGRRFPNLFAQQTLIVAHRS
jgi:2-polyprenyl-3-methyl-5-hydroxy-6-metoxy-1,4-benzoquinol methylase